MIKRIAKIENRGIFRSYISDTTLPSFDKYNVFYGLNGSGKSTLASLLRDLEIKTISDKFPTNKWEIETDQGNITNDNIENHSLNIRVFNTDFVNANVFTPKGVKSIVYISEKDNEAKNKLDKKTQEKKEKETELSVIQSELYGIPNDKKNKGLVTANETFLTDAAKRIKAQFKVIEVSDVRLLNYDKSKLRKFIEDNAQILKSKKSILSANEIEKLSKIIKPQNKEDIVVILDNYITKGLLDKAHSRVNELLHQSITNNCIQRLKENTALSQWIHQGLKEFHSNNSNICEFCGQLLPKHRIAELNAHFSNEFTILQETIGNTIEWLNSLPIIPEFPHSSLLYEEYIADYELQKNEFKKHAQLICNIIEDWKQALIKKRANPFEIIDKILPIDDTLYQKVIELFDGTIDILKNHNAKFENLERITTETKNKLELHYVAEEVNSYDFLTKKDREAILITKKRDTAYKIDALQISINEIQSRLSDEKFGEKEFNDRLHNFLGRDDLSLSHQEDGSYLIKRSDGTSAMNNTLSEGEKTAIGLIYFITKLRENGNKIEDTVVVLDDPISSFDSDHLFHANYYIQQECETAKQFIIFTHSFKFFTLLKYWITTKCNQYKLFVLSPIINNNQRQGNIQPCDHILQHFDSEYHWMFNEVYKFTLSPQTDYISIHTISNISRQLLESFLSFKYGRKKLEKCFNEITGFSSLNKVRKFVNYYSHKIDFGDSTKGFNENMLSESATIVPLVLELIKHVDSTHYNSMMNRIMNV